ncbi:MAG: HlyC/CorC family transporter [Chloroflexi bacterium]|nr:HlyC/CorC family transporter [Chloroflexota bacterium]
MDSGSSLALALLALGLGCFSLAVLAEGALASVSRDVLRDRAEADDARAARLTHLLQRPRPLRRFLLSLRLLLALVVTLVVTGLLARDGGIPWGRAAGLLAATLLVLLALQTVARVLAHRFGTPLALALAPGLYALSLVLRPLQGLRRTVGLPQGALDVEQHTPAEEQMETQIAREVQEAAPEPREREMIRAILEMEDTTARDIMVPRVDIVAAEVTDPPSRVVALMEEHGHSRLPVYENTIDYIVGIVYARDLLPLLTSRSLPDPLQAIRLPDLLRPPFFIPETMRLNALLREFQQRRVHLAIVVDEYGGTAGLVTMEDLLEEIVGEIVDEFDESQPQVQVIDQDEAILDARISLADLNQLFAVSLQGEGFDTVGGFVYSRLGKIPNPGDTVEADGLRIEVLSTAKRRIQKVRVQRQLQEPRPELP